jgi:hypothetical protein
MSYIQDGTLDKLEKHKDEDAIKLYLDRYISFFEQFAKIDQPLTRIQTTSGNGERNEP